MLFAAIVSTLWIGSAVSGFTPDVHQQRLFDYSVSVDAEHNLILDSTSDGVLEVVPLLAHEADTYLGQDEEGAEIREPLVREEEEWVVVNAFDEGNWSALSHPHWAVTYTPYTSAGECKAAGEMHEDAFSIARKGFSAIRLFSTDCDVLSALEPAARAQSLQLIPTVYISEGGINESVEEQIEDLLEFGKWDLISMIVVGNEAIFYEYTSASDLAVLLEGATKRLRAAGFTGPMTTVEHPAIIERHADLLCPHLHVLASSAQPFFAGDVEARDAGLYVERQLSKLESACGDRRDGYILETGWPSQGRKNGLAVPGRQAQRTAVGSMLALAGSKIALSSFEDERWREPGELSAEQFWGCSHLCAESE